MDTSRRSFLRAAVAIVASSGTFGASAPHAAPSGRYNVKDYGAIGDGEANDTAGIRAAIAAAAAAGGGVVYIPAGTYRIFPAKENEDCLTINADNIVLQGDGRQKTVLTCFSVGGAVPAPGAYLFRGSGVLIQGTSNPAAPRKNISVRGLRITGNVPPSGDITVNNGGGFGWDTTHKGVYLGADHYTDAITIEDVEIDNFLGELIYAGGRYNGKLFITNCKLHGCNADAISCSAEVHATGNECWDNANACVESAHVSAKENGYYTNNIFEPGRTLRKGYLRGVCIVTTPDAQVVISNNVFSTTLKDAIYSTTLHNATITNNTFKNFALVGANVGAISFAAKKLYGGDGKFDNIAISGNRFQADLGAPSWIIFLAGAEVTRMMVENNVVTAASGNMSKIAAGTAFLHQQAGSGKLAYDVTVRKNSASVCNVAIRLEDPKDNTRPIWQENQLNERIRLPGGLPPQR